MSNDGGRVARFSKLFGNVLRGRQTLTFPLQYSQFLEALCLQPDPPVCVDKIIASNVGLSSLQNAFWSNIFLPFLNGSATDALLYLQAPQIKTISSGQFLTKMMQAIAEPLIFLNFHVQVHGPYLRAVLTVGELIGMFVEFRDTAVWGDQTKQTALSSTSDADEQLGQNQEPYDLYQVLRVSVTGNLLCFSTTTTHYRKKDRLPAVMTLDYYFRNRHSLNDDRGYFYMPNKQTGIRSMTRRGINCQSFGALVASGAARHRLGFGDSESFLWIHFYTEATQAGFVKESNTSIEDPLPQGQQRARPPSMRSARNSGGVDLQGFDMYLG
ncbi:hypothetical protein EV421DRAFT_1739353 [Armillaria borealis]|uniref:Uncharacterized protein n=1 Tax=Armillaria borealis TaxID=47425 RepID=A0AA39J6B9_9AGAR|nr:hypothetical protein EV421DRAFT_1739353 [Armillaria borealis]